MLTRRGTGESLGSKLATSARLMRPNARNLLVLFVAALLSSIPVGAQILSVRDARFTPISQPSPQTNQATELNASRPVPDADFEPDRYLVYPVAGTLNQDVYIPYFVDLDPTPGVFVFNCSHLSYDGNRGEDPYVRGFVEQDIGVPVFAAIGGTVTDVHSGEPDHNTSITLPATPNSVTILHGSNQRTDYTHLRRDVLVKPGDVVTAGTQIGWVGSSGQSTWPHIHFESQFRGNVYEPLAGACRPGRSYFEYQPNPSTAPFASAVTVSPAPFYGLPLPPSDSSPSTGSFSVGMQTIYVRAELANVGPISNYTLQLTSPSGITSQATLTSQYQQEFLSAYFAINANFTETGTWVLSLNLGGMQLFAAPFTVVPSFTQLVNRPPNMPNATLDPIVAGEVPVCRANMPLIADPDYDIVSYTYTWTVNGLQVRSVISAATTDSIGQEYSATGAMISCSITASDGRIQTQPSQAFYTVSRQFRHRRAIGR